MKWWMWILAAYAGMSLVAFVMLWMDKRRARRNRRRIPERALHRIEWLGGFPGSLVAQRVFRHKNRKRSYHFVTWGIVFVHVAVWLIVLGWPYLRDRS